MLRRRNPDSGRTPQPRLRGRCLYTDPLAIEIHKNRDHVGEARGSTGTQPTAQHGLPLKAATARREVGPLLADVFPGVGGGLRFQESGRSLGTPRMPKEPFGIRRGGGVVATMSSNLGEGMR